MGLVTKNVSSVLICHSRDTNETLCSERPSVAIILRYTDKMTELYIQFIKVIISRCQVRHNASIYSYLCELKPV